MTAEDIFVLGFLSILVLIGLMVTGYGVRDVWRGYASASWPTAIGVVLESNASLSDTVRVLFGYEVRGKQYQTRMRYFGQGDSSSSSAEVELERLRYPAGAKVPVRYYPKDPSLSVIRTGIYSDALLFPAFGIGLVLMGLTFTLMYLALVKNLRVAQIGFLSFAAIFLLMGGSALALGLLRLYDAHQSRSWPVARGKIVYSKLDSRTSAERTSVFTRRSLSTTTIRASLVYVYVVNDCEYYSDVRRFGALEGSSFVHAEEIIERYPVDSEVPVAYSPSDPNLAVLEPGINYEVFVMPAVGAVFLLFGFAVVFFFVPRFSSRGTEHGGFR